MRVHKCRALGRPQYGLAWQQLRPTTTPACCSLDDAFQTVQGAPRRVKIIWVQPSFKGSALSEPFIVKDRMPGHVTNLPFDEGASAPTTFGAEPEALRCAQ